jgi:energy-coupling factor transport system ATP-binding protein
LAERLTLEEVSYSYPLPGREDLPALDGISLAVEPGEVLCVAGANGSGKSTLAQVCAGLLAPTAGSMGYGGEKIEGRRRLLSFRRKVGLLFQNAEDQLFADTVFEDVAFGPRNHGLKGEELETRVASAAGHAGIDLDELGGRSPFSLSEGEKRRVALAGVLALDPEVLVLDEPFIGLDFDNGERLKGVLGAYREERGASVVIVTHELADAWSLADRFVLLDGGRCAAVEEKSELVRGDIELAGLGMRLPQWGALARGLIRCGVAVADPSDPVVLARAMAERRRASDGR